MKTGSTNDITIRQNQSEFIELLKGQRQAYTESKKFLLFDVLTPLLALLLPALMIYNQGFEFLFGVISTVATLIYLFIVYIREKRNSTGAIIQEEFDTTLFDLGWNGKIAEFKARLETKNKLSEKYNKGKLDNWYSHEVKGFLPHNIAVLLCQRINLAWEVDLKKNYTLFWVALAVLYYTAMFISLLWCNVDFRKALLIFLPSIPLLIYVVLLNRSIKKQIKNKEETLNKVDKYIGKYSSNKDIPSTEILREIQDSIFKNRLESDKIPDFYYNWKRDKYEKDMHKTTKTIVDNFKKPM